MTEETKVIPDSRAPAGSPERKAYQNLKARESRERRKPKPSATFKSTVADWDQNLKKLMAQDLPKYIALCSRHARVQTLLDDLQQAWVEFWTEEKDGIDVQFLLKEIAEDIQQHGQANYREIESAMGLTWPCVIVEDVATHQLRERKSFQGDAVAEAYKSYGLQIACDKSMLYEAEKLAQVAPAPEPIAVPNVSLPDATGDSTTNVVEDDHDVA